MEPHPFIPGKLPEYPEPLARFLPPTPMAIASEWLQSIPFSNKERPWIIDPFGASPRLAVEIARAGWKVMVAANNPVMRFLLEFTSTPPAEADLIAALAELAASHKGHERIEPHIRSIYTIACPSCSSDVEVDAFLWEKGASHPYGCVLNCKSCGAAGEYPLPRFEAEKANTYAASGLHQARALERVAPANDPDRMHAEEALEVYLPRAVYVLFTLINRVDGLTLNPARRKAIQALLLSACDMANSLWAFPNERERPRQLVMPPRFREKNIWSALEEAIPLWISKYPPVPLTIWPALPPDSGGICLYEGPLRDLVSALKQNPAGLQFSSVLTALPRPNQAFWTLSALWSGWLWGRDAVGPFKSVLRRRRYDWSWHYTALHAAFESLGTLLEVDTPMLGLVGEAEAGMLTAALCAAGEADFYLTSVAIRSEQAQILWRKGKPATLEKGNNANQTAIQAIHEYLTAYGQPAPFLPTWSAGLWGIVNAEYTPSSIEVTPDSEPVMGFSEAQNTLKDILTYRGGFLRFGGGEILENSQWWLRPESEKELNIPEHPIADRLEIEVVNQLVHNQACTATELESHLFQAFPGLLTPDDEWLPVILDSYAIEEVPESGHWHLRPEDNPAARRTDLEKMREQLALLAQRTGFSQEGDFPLIWYDDHGIQAYWFFPMVSAVIANIILGKTMQPPSPASKSIVVIPGGRANLAAYKLRRDPRLRRLCQPYDPATTGETPNLETGWRIIKLRHLRWLVENVGQMQQPLEELLRLDPLTFSAPQMRLL